MKNIVSEFADGLKSVFSSLVERRNALNQNEFSGGTALQDTAKRSIYKTGIGNKIVRIKAGYALNDTIKFCNKSDKDFYNKRLAKELKRATKFMLVYGRGVIMLHHAGDNLSKPLTRIDKDTIRIKAFSGDLVTVANVEFDVSSVHYNKPKTYYIRGFAVHHTRIIDVCYVEPPEFEAGNYNYGGISEFELIHNQLITDGIVERASATIIEKASSFIYKVVGFKDNLRAKKDHEVVNYFSRIEDMRSIYGAILLDAEDNAEAVNQNLTNLQEVNENSLRRLAMVCGVPLAWLVGENVKGMNSSGDNERLVFQDMIEALQSDYIIDPLNDLLNKLGIDSAEFKENQGETPLARAEYDTKVITNAKMLWEMGEDFGSYLEEKGVTEKDEWRNFFEEEVEEEEPPVNNAQAMLAELLSVDVEEESDEA